MVTFVLHTHLPHVLHHGTWPHGSDWLCEAVAECYVPILNACHRLLADGIRPGITFDISPVLCEQLAHPDFPAVFTTYCEEHIALAKGDALHFEKEKNSEFAKLSEQWATWYADRLEDFRDTYQTSIVGALKSLQDSGAIEVLTCGVTHGYLPLLAEDASVDLQVRLAVENYQRHFGRSPRGIWLPECAYRPAYPWRTYLPVAAYAVARMRDGIEQVLSRYNLEYFITDEGALQQSTPLGVETPNGRVALSETYGEARKQLEAHSVYQVYRAGGNDHQESVAFFTRNQKIALQVWSGDTGYPGDPDYLDFHKKFFRSALRYWRVTDNKADMQYKQSYVSEWAEHKAIEHAKHFSDILEVTGRYHLGESEQLPTICLPFDTELFGHWWFEGPLFLEHVIRNIHASHILSTSTTSEKLDLLKPTMVVALPESSWGRNGNHDVWMNPDVQWTWEREYKLENRMRMLMEKHKHGTWDSLMKRLVLAAFRQMLLAQASDWQFLITTFSSREYAAMRFHNHATDAMQLADAAERYAVSGGISVTDRQVLEACEERDSAFQTELEHYLFGGRIKESGKSDTSTKHHQ